MIKSVIYTTILMCLFIGAKAQNTQRELYPQPQKVQLFPERFSMNGYLLSGDIKPGSAYLSLLQGDINSTDPREKLPLKIKPGNQNNSTLNQSGAYHLILSPEEVSINAYDERGVFYAVQTLHQLYTEEDGKFTLPKGEIVDYPDVAHRGTVEGFYGEPWTFEDRLEQIRFYGRLKMNTYIYGPKDDPFHSSPNWRLPYPADEAEKIKTLVRTADSNFVDFVWAIHPGLDIQWNLKDSQAVLHKFDLMYDLGVRNFAVFFDDISGVGTDAHKQAGLLNYIQDSFLNVKKDVGPLIMCPTEYNKSWSNKNPDTYLDILGKELDPAIHIMWTGNTVVADIHEDDLKWVNNRIRRPAFVWWNFPVSDYVRDHLLMGPAYGLDPNAAREMSGFVSNPMDKSEASKVGVFGVAMYSWNMKAYDPQKAWEAANRYVMPEAPEAFMLFNAHNSDLGPNGHGYRREESVIMKPAIESFLNSYKNGSFDIDLSHKIKTEFKNISLAPGIIQISSNNKRLLEQIMPWLIQFKWLGKSGVAAMEMVENLQNNQNSLAWSSYLELQDDLFSMDMVDKTYNQNPYQPGVKTGSLVLTPFVKTLFELGGSQLLNPGKSLSDIPASTLSPFASSKLTNSEKLKNQPLQLTNNSVAYSPVLESIILQPGDYVGIKVAENLKATELSFDLRSGSVRKWGAMEWSADGENWKTIEWTEKNGKGKIHLNNFDLKFIRFINPSTEKQTVFLKEFKVMVEASQQNGNQAYALDGSIHTFETFSKQNSLPIALPANLQNKSLILLVDKADNTDILISSINEKGKKTIVYSGREKYIVLDKTKMKNTHSIIFSLEAEGAGKLYEIVSVD